MMRLRGVGLTRRLFLVIRANMLSCMTPREKGYSRNMGDSMKWNMMILNGTQCQEVY